MERVLITQEKRKKTGIMGGTFNPIHIGHLMLAEWAHTDASLDEILFMPTGQSYLKRDLKVISGEDRLHMVNLAIDGCSYFRSSDMEILRGGNTYTYETLESLKEMEPDTDFYFIMGADCLFSIENWKCPERIFGAGKMLAAVRGNASWEAMEAKCQELQQRFGAQIKLLPFPAMEISSSDIRQRVNEGKSIRYMVPESVISYIEDKQFYR